MSGGSMGYLHLRLLEHTESKLDESRDEGFYHNTPARIAFAELLRLVSAALKAIEWVDSGDIGYYSDEAAINAFLNFKPKKKPRVIRGKLYKPL